MHLPEAEAREIVFTAEANPDTITRVAIITIHTERLAPQTIIVKQEPRHVVTISGTEFGIGYQEGSSAIFRITSNTKWAIQCYQPWLNADFTAGTGNAEIVLTADANPDLAVREALVTISAEGLPVQTITITQEASLPSGLNDIAKDILLIYPNPVKNVLYVDHASGSELVLIDLQGRIILNQKLCSNHETIDLSFLTHGEYMIKTADQIVKIVKY